MTTWYLGAPKELIIDHALSAVSGVHGPVPVALPNQQLLLRVPVCVLSYFAPSFLPNGIRNIQRPHDWFFFLPCSRKETVMSLQYIHETGNTRIANLTRVYRMEYQTYVLGIHQTRVLYNTLIPDWGNQCEKIVAPLLVYRPRHFRGGSKARSRAYGMRVELPRYVCNCSAWVGIACCCCALLCLVNLSGSCALAELLVLLDHAIPSV